MTRNAEQGNATASGTQGTPPFWRRHPAAVAVVRYALLAAVLYYVGRALVAAFLAVPWRSIPFAPHYVALSVLALVAMSFMQVWFHYSVLGAFCRPPPFRVMMALTWVPPMGRYIPGKVASIAGAVVLLRRQNVPGAVAGSTVLIRQALTIAVGLMAAATLPFWDSRNRLTSVDWPWLCLPLLVLVACLHPKVFGALTGALLRRLGREPLVRLPDLWEYSLPVAQMLLIWAMFGLAFWLMARSVTDASAWQIPTMSAAAALAATVGFLAFFAPAGIGVREGILLVILGRSLGPENAAIVVVAMRLLHTVIEVALAGLGWWVLLHRRADRPGG